MITMRSLVAKIAQHYGVVDVKDIVVRFGDLDLVFDAKTPASELEKRLYTDFRFSEANMIGVTILNHSTKAKMIK